MKDPIVTIVVPIHDGLAYLSETLDSLLSQTYRDFELLAIDDGSTDASSDVVRSLKDERVRLIQKSNGGLCEALDRGIAEAKAPYVARSDQDDISFPERLERQLQVMEDHPEAIALFRLQHQIRAQTPLVERGQIGDGNRRTKGVRADERRLPVRFNHVCANRGAEGFPAGGFRQSYYPVDDWDLECRLAQVGKVLILREPLTAYRFQTSANTYRVFSDMPKIALDKRLLPAAVAISAEEFIFEQFRLAQANDLWSRMGRYCRDSSKLHMRIAGQRFLDGRYLAAAGHLVRAVMTDPSDMAGRVRRYLSRS